ncbi:MAG: response regulator [Methanoregula sp.]|nr:response regulator [Methanoregula sp.]
MAAIPRILIVEDDEIICNLITTMLERKGYSIVGQTGFGEEAIIKVTELEPDLVLMDIGLNGKMDGVAAARFIFHLFHVPIVFLTANCDDSLIERAKTAQPLGYILKPFTDKDLTSNVELALYNHSVRKKFLDICPIGEPGTLMTIRDLVLALDFSGNIVFYNPYAAQVLELTGDEILMHPWQEVMRLINDQTGEEITDPVPDVVRQMLVVTQESNTTLVTKNGRNRRVSVTVRPISDDKHEPVGVFMQIHEKH